MMMNQDVVKPFPCKEEDCGMSFFTEDHLSVHIQAKHNKLNIEIPRGNANLIFADQTPTPTRLLNNCEELRVFDDLQNINPFEEGFRRAAEDNSNGIVRDDHTQTVPSNQDTLHTPQILPQYENRPMKNEQFQDDSENLKYPTSFENTTHIPKAELTRLNDAKNGPKSTITILPQPSNVHNVPVVTTSTISNLTERDFPIPSESVKDKLKNIILNNSSGSQSDKKRMKMEQLATSTFLIGPVPLEAATAMLITNSDSSNFKKSSNESPNPQNNTKRISDTNGMRKRIRADKTETSNLKVERNRAAARRYRTKMKIQSQALQEKYDKSQRELSLMKKELTELRKELTHVKALLLLHKDCPQCPVSKAVESNS